MDERMQSEQHEEVESPDAVEDIDLVEDDSDDVVGGGGIPLNKPIVGLK